MIQKTFCIHCGSKHAMLTWPKKCSSCSMEMFSNPKPVAVVLLEIEEGVLLVRRAIEPRIGHLALPGGYVNSGETVETAAARELQEETGIEICPTKFKLIHQHSEINANCLLLFFQAPKINISLKDLKLNSEVLGFEAVTAPVSLAFPTHQAVLEKFFQSKILSKDSCF